MSAIDTARGDATVLRNAACDRARPYGAAEQAILSRARGLEALAAISAWAGYAPTPVHALSTIAAACRLAEVCYKDEGWRFGLDSFKATGGAYAVERIARARGVVNGLVVTAATDGNHGRSVAWGASRVGARAVIFLPENASPGREDAIRRFGGEVVRVPGTFDDAVRASAKAAATHGWELVCDTSGPGHDDAARDIMQGYQVLALEAQRQVGRPTHIFVQAGVGGLAAAVVAHAWETWGAERPITVIVEPVNAACYLASFAGGRRTAVGGEMETIMVGLACGEPSPLAWPILQRGADAAVAVVDARAREAMRTLANLDIVGGESGVAGLAALLAVSADEAARAALSLNEQSRVLCYGTEGATDPTIYRQIVGRAAEQVRRGQP